jgi:hypothetical protein
VRVLAAASNNSVDGNEDGEDGGQGRLHDDEDNTGDCLGGLRETKFLNENQNTTNGEDTDDLHSDVDSH